MNTISFLSRIHIVFFLFILISSCEGQVKTELSADDTRAKVDSSHNHLIGALSPQECENDPALLINSVVNTIFQDESGIIWFGTEGRGVIKYDGDFIEYLSTKQGFGGTTVIGIVGDDSGNVWFATHSGLSKYDGKTFTNYTAKDGLVSTDLRSIWIDKTGVIWIGTTQGLSLFDGQNFTPLPLPGPGIVQSMMEDSKGKVWLGTTEGAYVYDANSFTAFSENDGLCDKVINDILEDKAGNFWFATQNSGVCFWDGSSFTHIPTEKKEDGSSNAWDLYQDEAGKIWFPIEGVCLYQYDGNTAINFFEEQSCVSHTIRYTFEDKDGRIWFGGWLGVYRYEG
jgi:ligand-binding sensor domain-containing protein